MKHKIPSIAPVSEAAFLNEKQNLTKLPAIPPQYEPSFNNRAEFQAFINEYGGHLPMAAARQPLDLSTTGAGPAKSQA